jgi:hypothetical protein
MSNEYYNEDEIANMKANPSFLQRAKSAVGMASDAATSAQNALTKEQIHLSSGAGKIGSKIGKVFGFKSTTPAISQTNIEKQYFLSTQPWIEPNFTNSREGVSKYGMNMKRTPNVHGRAISNKNQMLNFKRTVKHPDNLVLNYESRASRKRNSKINKMENKNGKPLDGVIATPRYWRSTNLTPNTRHVINNKNGKPVQIEVNHQSIVHYTAKAPMLRGSTRKVYESPESNALKQKALKEGAKGLDFSKFQKMLQSENSAEQEEGATGLRTLKSMLVDGRTLTREAMDKKYATLKTVESLAGGLAMVLGAAGGSGGVQSAVTTGLSYGSTAVGAAATVATTTGHSATFHSIRQLFAVAKPVVTIAAKVAASILIGTVLGISGGVFPLAVAATVSAAAGAGAHLAAGMVKKASLTTEMNADELEKTITTMLENRGVIMENNPMFDKERIQGILEAAVIAKQSLPDTLASLPARDHRIALQLILDLNDPMQPPEDLIAQIATFAPEDQIIANELIALKAAPKSVVAEEPAPVAPAARKRNRSTRKKVRRNRN